MQIAPLNPMVHLVNKVVSRIELFGIPEEDACGLSTLPELFSSWREASVNPALGRLGHDHFSNWEERLSSDSYAIVRDYHDVILSITDQEIRFSLVHAQLNDTLATVVIGSSEVVSITILDAGLFNERLPSMYTGVLWRTDEVLSGAIMKRIREMGESDRNLFHRLYRNWISHERETELAVDFLLDLDDLISM